MKEFKEHQRVLSKLAVTITSPPEGDCVARKVKVTGRTENLPKNLTLWQVVEAGRKWHPQTHLDAKSWTATATVGSAGFGNGKEALFPIHIVATTKTAHDIFNSYFTEQGKTQKWHGVPKPAGAKTVTKRVVRRDDHATALRSLIGTYDEYRAKPPRATGGLIRIQGSANGTLTVTASTDAGDTVWTGSITVDSTSGDATGTYRYTNRSDQGTLRLQQNDDDVAVTGADRAAPSNPFHSFTWHGETAGHAELACTCCISNLPRGESLEPWEIRRRLEWARRSDALSAS